MDLPHPPALPRMPCRPAAHCATVVHCTAAVHRDLYAAHRDRAADSPSIAPPPPLPSPTPIVPLSLTSPIATPTNAHCHRRHCHPLIAPCRSSHTDTHPPLSNLTACQGACWGDGGGDEALQLTSDGAGNKRCSYGGQ